MISLPHTCYTRKNSDCPLLYRAHVFVHIIYNIFFLSFYANVYHFYPRALLPDSVEGFVEVKNAQNIFLTKRLI